MIKKEVKVKGSGTSDNLFCGNLTSFDSLRLLNMKKREFLLHLRKSVNYEWKQPPEVFLKISLYSQENTYVEVSF